MPEPLHPASAQGLPSADDLDRAEALRAAVADLPAGQRQAIELHYYAPVLVVLAGNAGSRALPLWLNGMAGYALWQSVHQLSGEPSGVPGDIPAGRTVSGAMIGVDLASRLLHAAGSAVTGVNVDELGP